MPEHLGLHNAKVGGVTGFHDLSLTYVLVHAGSCHDFIRCWAEVSMPHTSGRIMHEYQLDRAKLSLFVELDMPSRTTSDVELSLFTCNG